MLTARSQIVGHLLRKRRRQQRLQAQADYDSAFQEGRFSGKTATYTLADIQTSYYDGGVEQPPLLNNAT